MIKKRLLPQLVLMLLLASILGCMSSEERAEELYQKGMSLLDKDPNQAEKSFKNALIMQKTMVKAMYGLALVSLHEGSSKSAHKFLEQALEQDPNYLDALIQSSQLLLAEGQLDLALIRCNQALAIDRDNVAALNLRAQLQLKLGDAKGAIEFAQHVLLKDVHNQEAYITLATERQMAKDQTKAIAYLDQALVANNKSLNIQLKKAIALEINAAPQVADQAYQTILTLFPDNIFAKKCYLYFLQKNNRQDGVEQQLRAIAQSAPQGDIQAKLDVVKFVTDTRGGEAGEAELARFVKDAPKNYGLAFVLLDLYQAKNATQQQDALLDQIVAKAGKTADGYRARGLVAEKFIRLGKRVEANHVLDEILKKDTRNGLALKLKAQLALDAKDYPGAIAYLRTVLRDSPKSLDAALMLATAYEKSNLMTFAEEQYSNAFVSSQYSATYGVPYADFLLRIKQPARADRVSKKIQASDLTGKDNLSTQIYAAINASKNVVDGSLSAYIRANETDAADVASITAIIQTYMYAGQYKEALDFINSVLGNTQNDADIALLKAQIHAAMGDQSTAINTLVGVIKADPKDDAAYQQLAATQLAFELNADAQDTAEQALSFLPENFELKLLKARIFVLTGRFDEAIKLYNQLLEKRPESIFASSRLAKLLVEQRGDGASMRRAEALTKLFKDNQAPEFAATYRQVLEKLAQN